MKTLLALAEALGLVVPEEKPGSPIPPSAFGRSATHLAERPASKNR
jgi:hypothetical protein